MEAGSFYVLPGGVATGSLDTPLFLKSNFLTWQPQTRYVTYHEPQWLRYVALQACSVRVKGYFADGEPVTVTLKELAEKRQYSLDLNYGRIRASSINSLPITMCGWRPAARAELRAAVRVTVG